MKATRTKPAERTLGWIGFLLALPVLAPVAAIAAALQRMSQSKGGWQRTASKVLAFALFPLFLIVIVVFIPYSVLLWLLSAVGLVRRHLPPTLIPVVEGHHSGTETFWRLDLVVPQQKPEVAAEVFADLVSRTLERLGETKLIVRPPESEVSAADAPGRIESWVRALRYGSQAEWWYLIAGGKARLHSVWWVDQGTISAEISVEGDPGEVDAICREFVEAIENGHPTVEVHHIGRVR